MWDSVWIKTLGLYLLPQPFFKANYNDTHVENFFLPATVALLIRASKKNEKKKTKMYDDCLYEWVTIKI